MTLTPVAVADFDDLRSLWADADFTREISGRPLSEEEVWFRLLRDLGHWSVRGYGAWSMRLIDGGAYVGSVGVFDYRRDLSLPFDAPELGWGVAPAFQRMGLAREGLAAALAWTDARVDWDRTVCMMNPSNTASFALAGQVGYRTYAEATYKDHAVILLERPRAG